MSQPNQIIDVEPLNVDELEPNGAALARVEHRDLLVRPTASLAEIEKSFVEYQKLCDRLIVADDLQRIGKKDFRKKSAWRKLAVAFGVSCDITDRSYERNAAGRIIRAEIIARATAPNGRHMDGLGACDLFEKCCPPDCPKKGWSNHTCCASDCSGAKHFSNPQHDIPATAETRAKNRACSDLFGMGEVSAEEIVDNGRGPAAERPQSRKRSEEPFTEADETLAGAEFVRRFAIACREIDMSDDERHALVAHATGGRTTSSKLVFKDEVELLQRWFLAIKDERYGFVAADDGKLRVEKLEKPEPDDANPEGIEGGEAL